MAPPRRIRDDREPPTIEGGQGALWNPNGGIQTRKGEKPHIWQEYELYRDSGLRPIRGAKPWGAGWWFLPLVIVIAVISSIWPPGAALLAALRAVW